MKILLTRILIVLLILLLGCITNDNDELSLAQVRLVKDTLITKNMISVSISDGRSKWRFHSEDFEHNPNYIMAWCAPEIETRTEGLLVLQFYLRDPNGGIVSNGQIELPLKGDWRWGINIWHEHRNPYFACWGCAGYKSFPILRSECKTSEKDSVFVVWGGNSISNPVWY